MMKRVIGLIMLLSMLEPCLAGEHWRGGGHGGGHGGYWHGGGYRSDGNDFVGGIVGGTLGALFGNWLSPPVVVVPQEAPQEIPEIVPGTPAWYAYCQNKYRSFNPQTGTYLGFDGAAHPCT